MNTTSSKGHVVFVGAGPGAFDLITVRGAHRLAQAEVVLFDALTDPAFRSLAPSAEWTDVGKRGFCSSTGQATIDALLVKHALLGQRVVRLKGGDPSVFGRLEEELQALAAHGISSEVVPGITSALAAAADAQRPLTRRGRSRSVTLSTAMTREGELRASRRADTEVFYMAGRQLGALGRRLLAHGWASDTAVLVTSRAGCADSLASTHTLSDLAAAALLHAGRPTVVCVGVGASAVVGAAASAVVGAAARTEVGAARPAMPATAARLEAAQSGAHILAA